jgi:hypothetical protein
MAEALEMSPPWTYMPLTTLENSVPTYESFSLDGFTAAPWQIFKKFAVVFGAY